MKAFKRFKLAIALAVILLLGAALVNADIVDISVATDKGTYLLGEDITVFVTAYNPNPELITLQFSTSMQVSYLLDSTYNWKENHGSYPWLTEQIIPSMASHTWTLVHGIEEMNTYPLTIGTHTVVGEVLGYGQSAPVHFQVVPEPSTAAFFVVGAILLTSGYKRGQASSPTLTHKNPARL
jgi:hypothetical protein